MAPGGDVIRDMLNKGASGQPVLILLDEVLKYMERAAAVGVLESTLQRQAKDFSEPSSRSGRERESGARLLLPGAPESLGNVGLTGDRQARFSGGSIEGTCLRG